MIPAAFLDRDGVLNEFVMDPLSGLAESPLAVEDVTLLEGAAEAALRLTRAGFALVCVTNQPAAAKGRTTVDALMDVHARVIELLAREGVQLLSSRVCLHHPEGVVSELASRCACRKPAAGMLLDAAEVLSLDLKSSWMLGDSDVDVGAGRAAGCRTALIEYPESARKRLGEAEPDLTAIDLADAVAQITGREAGLKVARAAV